MVLGSKTQLHGRAEASDRLLCEVPGMNTDYAPGDTITFGWDVSDTLIYEDAI
jgi:putative spermidine/putrescine transport system ATP-binding protein